MSSPPRSAHSRAKMGPQSDLPLPALFLTPAFCKKSGKSCIASRFPYGATYLLLDSLPRHGRLRVASISTVICFHPKRFRSPPTPPPQLEVLGCKLARGLARRCLPLGRGRSQLRKVPYEHEALTSRGKCPVLRVGCGAPATRSTTKVKEKLSGLTR